MTPGSASSGATGSRTSFVRLNSPEGGEIPSGRPRDQISQPMTPAMITEMNQPGLLPHMSRLPPVAKNQLYRRDGEIDAANRELVSAFYDLALRERVEKQLAVTLSGQPAVEDDDDSLVRLTSDEP